MSDTFLYLNSFEFRNFFQFSLIDCRISIIGYCFCQANSLSGKWGLKLFLFVNRREKTSDGDAH